MKNIKTFEGFFDKFKKIKKKNQTLRKYQYQTINTMQLKMKEKIFITFGLGGDLVEDHPEQ